MMRTGARSLSITEGNAAVRQLSCAVTHIDLMPALCTTSVLIVPWRNKGCSH